MTGTQAGGGAVSQDRAGVREQVGRTGGGRRPLQAGLRQARHLEPEVQPGLGQAAGPGTVSAGDRAQGDRLLPDEAEPLRPAARQSQGLHQARLGPVDRDDGRESRRFRQAGGAGVALRQRIAEPRAADRLVRHGDRRSSRASRRARWWAACLSRCWPTRRCGRSIPAAARRAAQSHQPRQPVDTFSLYSGKGEPADSRCMLRTVQRPEPDSVRHAQQQSQRRGEPGAGTHAGERAAVHAVRGFATDR